MPQVKPLPAYSENASVSYAHGENKALGATVFSGSNDETAPAFVRITAIQGKDGEAAAGTMSLLGGNAIVPNQVISRADFDKVVWDASKNEGGSFSFVPVQDAQGTALPGALEQTVTIHEAPALPTYEADMSVAYTYNQSKAVGAAWPQHSGCFRRGRRCQPAGQWSPAQYLGTQPPLHRARQQP